MRSLSIRGGEADDSLVEVRPMLSNLVKLVQVVDHPRRLFHLALVILAPVM